MRCECGRPSVARGLCSKHYQRWLKTPEGQASKTPRGLSPIERVRRAKTVKRGDCLLWTGATASGYGVITVDQKNVSVPRIVLADKIGRELTGKALHTCNTKRCVNPDHLYQGGTGRNSLDAYDDEAIPSGDRHHWAKVPDRSVVEMIALRKEGVSLKELAGRYEVSESTVSRICNGKRRKRTSQGYPKR